ncbi:MAG TPA: VWA domain-containing protein [Gaiellaceae bacterium]|nr:VWA domain-containing protein [Gaiellaceae bacterium]
MSLAFFSFAAPWYLVALVAVPLLLALRSLARRRRARYAVAFTNLAVLARTGAARRRPTWQRLLPVAVLMLGVTVAVFALARPKVELSTKNRTTTVVLLVDVSDSMRALDILPSRLEAAVTAMHAFVNTLPASDKVGLVSFSDKVNVLVAPTADHVAVHRRLDVLAPQGGTALGDGIAGAVKLIVSSLAAAGVHHTPGHRLPAAIVLESDGDQNRGTVSPFKAAQLAKAAGIPIYGVALGQRTGVIHQGQGFFALTIPVPPDPDVVTLLTRTTGGKAYTATSAEKLNAVYRHLGSTVGTTPEPTEITSWFEGAAALLLLAGLALARLRGPVLP